MLTVYGNHQTGPNPGGTASQAPGAKASKIVDLSRLEIEGLRMSLGFEVRQGAVLARALFIITEPVPLERCSEIGWRFLAALAWASEQRLDQLAHRHRGQSDRGNAGLRRAKPISCGIVFKVFGYLLYWGIFM
jgi:hypothetical protein